VVYVPESGNRFLGKFRGRVTDNNDPRRIGRIRAEVPDVLGSEPSMWALPCLPFTGEQAGHYNVPPPGAGVWIEFEQGDPSYPIWSGCWYGTESELPTAARRADHPVVIQTTAGHRVEIDDTAGGGILLRAAGGPSVRIDSSGVYLDDGTVGIGGKLTVANGMVVVPGELRAPKISEGG
jgi:hypothetical protein